MRQHAVKAKAAKADGTDGDARPTLLRHIAHSDMPESELGELRLAREAQVMITGGVHTTSRSLEYIAYHLIANRKIRLELQRELEPVMAGFPEEIPSLSHLEKLPYLSGVVKEGLRWVLDSEQRQFIDHSRISRIITHRLTRVSPEVPLKYKNWIIPRGVGQLLDGRSLRAAEIESFVGTRWDAQSFHAYRSRNLS